MGFDTKNIFGVAEWLACIDTGFESFTQRICNDVLRSTYVITKTVLRSTHVITRHSAAFYIRVHARMLEQVAVLRSTYSMLEQAGRGGDAVIKLTHRRL